MTSFEVSITKALKIHAKRIDDSMIIKYLSLNISVCLREVERILSADVHSYLFILCITWPDSTKFIKYDQWTECNCKILYTSSGY